MKQACAIAATLESKINEIIEDQRFLKDRGPALLSAMRNLNASESRNRTALVARGLKRTIRVTRSLVQKHPHRAAKLESLLSELIDVAAQVEAVSQALSPPEGASSRQRSAFPTPTTIPTVKYATPTPRRQQALATPGGTQLLSELRRTIHLADELLRPNNSSCPSPELSPQPAAGPHSFHAPGYTSVQQSRMEVQEMIRLASKLNELVLHHVGSSPSTVASQPKLPRAAQSRPHISSGKRIPTSRSLRFGATPVPLPSATAQHARKPTAGCPVLQTKSTHNRQTRTGRTAKQSSSQREYDKVWRATLDDCLLRTQRRASSLQVDLDKSMKPSRHSNAAADTPDQATTNAVLRMREACKSAYYMEQTQQLQASRLQAARAESIAFSMSSTAPQANPRLINSTARKTAGNSKRFMSAVTQAITGGAGRGAAAAGNLAGTNPHTAPSNPPRAVGGWLSLHGSDTSGDSQYIHGSAVPRQDSQAAVHVLRSPLPAAAQRAQDTRAPSRTQGQQQRMRRPSQQEIIQYATKMAILAAVQPASR